MNVGVTKQLSELNSLRGERTHNCFTFNKAWEEGAAARKTDEKETNKISANSVWVVQ